ncbi:molecular chaperone DnaK [Photobacterium proteolyticum]|uniref:Molecular chaperone DnaK n=1 Tax=Photobacterium proteolyticum TaxID=1903952 RepID=A0A1Q9G740_9GAMM|nr:molecular chaperone DnaK [Photobacterium proteolyticum]OLQ70049.1 molecular chaperone DnaK [Photobacterium proteolyticum]
MSTKLVSEWKITEEQARDYGINISFETASNEFIEKNVILFLEGKSTSGRKLPFLDLLNNTFQMVSDQLDSQRWLTLTNEIYLDKKAKGCWMLKSNNNSKIHRSFSSGESVRDVRSHINKSINDKINQWDLPTYKQLICMTNLGKTVPFNKFSLSYGRISLSRYSLYIKGNKVQSYDCDNDVLQDVSTNGVSFPFLKLSNNTLSGRSLFVELLIKGLTPISLKNSEAYKLLLSIFHRERHGIFEEQRVASEALLQHQYGLIRDELVIKALLNEDKVRADIAPYHKKKLEDTQLGHWSLWQDELSNEKQETISFSNKLVARDPKSSINDGVVGIDFGTKSTVVVYQKDNVNIHPMRIGTGDLSKEVAAFHYENPTIMEFNDLEQFISGYQAKANKPFTRWQDLTISHTAQNSMLGSESSQFNTFLDDIKQWAGDKNRKLKIVGKQGKVIDLPPFLELSDTVFNPIEIYAYYLGLYINNQNNGIYLDYILSFPVTYEMPIRDKIIESFEKGLKKSLPAELGEETISQLTVTKGASEPAAYALVALQAYDFNPCNDDRVFYSVFDFGGGTTDFDFGIFREATGRKERRFDYVIEHFGAGGDKFLGGENLLELLAFEVFKKNKTALLAKGIQFEKHPEKDAFAGSEQLLNNSQEAKINTKTLCEMLRPFWEGHEESSLDLSQGSIAINLTDVNGTVHTAFELDVNEDELNKLLHDRIERGVINFFNALRLAFSNTQQSLHDIDSIKIFLAGNSSQSHFVKEIFEQQIALQHEAMGLTSDQESRFELFSPLGADKNDVEKPTGKTGVAFGLIESREGGSIMVVDHNVEADDIRFKYYLGESRKNCFKPLIDREVAFSQWVEFIDAGYQKFEIFYTEQPYSSTGKVPISDSSIKKRVVKLDFTNDEAMVYLRVVSPTQIEYVVAHEDAISNEVYLNNIQSIDLS